MGFAPWQVLALIGLGLVLLEFFTTAFYWLPAGLAFLGTALVAGFVESWPMLLAVLCLNLLVVYAIFHRFVWPRLAVSAPKTGAEGMIGKTATVTEAILPATGQGYVKLYGDRWQAVSKQEFAVGDRVVITGIEGNKVIVAPLDDLGGA